MNPRPTTIIVGVVILVLGVLGLAYPDRVMAFLGFMIVQPSQAAVALGEIRATYGGLFTVMGAFTIFAGMRPHAHRSTILFVGLLWLGICAGRLIGAYVDGGPGVPGWLFAAFELIVGGVLIAAWWGARDAMGAEP